MILVAYYATISLVYFVLNFIDSRVADGAVVAFIALLMAPACYSEYRRVRRKKA